MTNLFSQTEKVEKREENLIDVDSIWQEFKPIVEKLKSQGYNGEQSWWKSRYSEDYLKINAKFDKDKRKKQLMWNGLWLKYSEEIMKKQIGS